MALRWCCHAVRADGVTLDAKARGSRRARAHADLSLYVADFSRRDLRADVGNVLICFVEVTRGLRVSCDGWSTMNGSVAVLGAPRTLVTACTSRGPWTTTAPDNRLITACSLRLTWVFVARRAGSRAEAARADELVCGVPAGACGGRSLRALRVGVGRCGGRRYGCWTTRRMQLCREYAW